MSRWKLIALAALGAFAAMLAATWWYGITGGRLTTHVGRFGLLPIFAATLVAMLAVVLWPSRKPTASARFPERDPGLTLDEIDLQLRRESAYQERQRRVAEDQAANSFTGKSGF